jgi:hypothetical protein
MQKKYIFPPKVFLNFVSTITITAIFLSVISGCAGSYGRINRDDEVTKAFKSYQVPSEYKYYYYGFDTRPYAVIGVDPKFDAGTKLWREVDPQSAAFEKMIFWVWEAQHYYPYGAHILDPAGNRVGLWFSSIVLVAIKFIGEDRIMVMPDTPFLRGPSADKENDKMVYGMDLSDYYAAESD